MKVVFENTKTGAKLRYDPEFATAIFLEIRGGGWNETQTALAMEDQRSVLDGEPVQVRDIYIYTEDE